MNSHDDRDTQAGDAQVHWLDDEEKLTWRAFRVATQLMQEGLDRQLQRDADMPHAYYMILAILSASPCRLRTMSELAEATSFSASRLSHAMTKLEKHGWVNRRRDEHCGRNIVATLTDAGFAALAEAAPGHVGQVRATLLDPLSRTEQRQLRVICEKLLASYGSPLKDAPLQ